MPQPVVPVDFVLWVLSKLGTPRPVPISTAGLVGGVVTIGAVCEEIEREWNEWLHPAEQAQREIKDLTVGFVEILSSEGEQPERLPARAVDRRRRRKRVELPNRYLVHARTRG